MSASEAPYSHQKSNITTAVMAEENAITAAVTTENPTYYSSKSAPIRRITQRGSPQSKKKTGALRRVA
jgi:hypothetical protein